MVLDVHGDAPHARIEGRAPRHGPAHQHAIDLEPEVVVQSPGPVPLNDEPAGSCGGGTGRSAVRLGRAPEVPLLLVARELLGNMPPPVILPASSRDGSRSHTAARIGWQHSGARDVEGKRPAAPGRIGTILADLGHWPRPP
jgi:hypothetical protein